MSACASPVSGVRCGECAGCLRLSRDATIRERNQLNANYFETYAALAASKANVTRLAAELAESVRALAVSQGEVERLKAELADVTLDRDGHQREREVNAVELLKEMGTSVSLRGDLERARGLLREQEWSMYDSSCGDYACRWCLALRGYDKGKHKPDCRLDAFLAPIASPEPDRASPEVTATNQGETK